MSCGILRCAVARIDSYHEDKPLLHFEVGAAGTVPPELPSDHTV